MNIQKTIGLCIGLISTISVGYYFSKKNKTTGFISYHTHFLKILIILSSFQKRSDRKAQKKIYRL